MDIKQQKIITDNIQILASNTKNYDKFVQLLLDEEVVTKKQINYIDENIPEDKRVEELYILITKRGPEAFRKLYNIFFNSGNSHLAFIISPHRSSNFSIPPQADGAGLTITEEEYRLDSDPKGMVLIVNIETIPLRNITREGSTEDVKRLEELWTDLGHKVVKHINLTKQDFEAKFKKFVQNFKGDCFTIFLMSHGKQDELKDENVLVEMHDSKNVETNWIIRQLSSHNTPHLSDIPKLIFVVTCRGELRDHGIDINKALSQRMIEEGKNIATDGVPVRVRPIVSNLIMIYPCSPGYVSYRDIKFGTWFVQELVSVFKHYADKETLEDMIKRVDRLLLNNAIFHNQGFQTVNIKAIGFNKKLYLKPQKASKESYN